jgi:hypothetical protein
MGITLKVTMNLHSQKKYFTLQADDPTKVAANQRQ